jgi:hypothetical protein
MARKKSKKINSIGAIDKKITVAMNVLKSIKSEEALEKKRRAKLAKLAKLQVAITRKKGAKAKRK